MTTLITGVTGAVGSRYARRAGGRIRVLVRDEERAAPWWNRGAEVVVGDLRDPDASERLLDDPWLGIVDTSRIRAELGYRPVYPTIYTVHRSGAL
jgi:hypothetical protein